MQTFNTLPMPEGFGLQVETPQGWRFRHCATFFVGDMCPDCHKTGFLGAANAINQVETRIIGIDTAFPEGERADQIGEQQETGEQTPEDRLLEDAARALGNGDTETAANLVTAANEAANPPAPESTRDPNTDPIPTPPVGEPVTPAGNPPPVQGGKQSRKQKS